MTGIRVRSFAALMPAAVLAGLSPSIARSQTAQAQAGGPGNDLVAESTARYVAEGKVPDSVGTGPYPAKKGQYKSLPNSVVYQPANLSALGQVKMPIYVFGNGACSEDGASQRQHLLEIASYGYLVIAQSGIYSGPGLDMSA